MNLNNLIVCNFIYSFLHLKKKKTTQIKIKSFIFYLLLLKFIFNNKFKIIFKKNTFNKFTILKAPYKNKMAQRRYYINKFFFKIILIFDKKKNFNFNFFKNFLNLGSFFFYNFFIKVRFLI